MAADVEIPAGLTGYAAGTVGSLLLIRERLKAAVDKYGHKDLRTSPLGFSNSIATLVVHICALEIRVAHLISGAEIPAKIRADFMMDEPQSPLPMAVGETAPSLTRRLDQSWGILLEALATVRDEDLEREIELNKRSLTVRRALSLLANHQAMHFGQMQMLMIQLAPDGVM